MPLSLIRVAFAFVLLSMLQCARGQDAIGFPENDEDLSIKNKDNRKPVYAPTRCGKNELYYPGDQQSDWICDCRPAYLYYPPTNECHAAYRTGPCDLGFYLVLPPNSVMPACVTNPCKIDGLVPFGGSCLSLGATLPCKHKTAAALGVNATSLAIQCLPLTTNEKINEGPPLINLTCPPGCKRNVNGQCNTPNSI